jgi:uncharacterized membrane protein YfcA
VSQARRSTATSIGGVALLVWSLWLAGMVFGARWDLFATGWFMSVTMAVGSFVAGATSEGGGAVAFPVMTLLFGIAPAVARDFSLMIQSVGMTSATATILYTGIRIEHRSLLWAGLGGAVGMIFGLEFIAGRLPPAFAKMLFTSTWLAFAFALYMINRYHDREVHLSIRNFRARTGLVLFGTGVVGGVISSITGSGLDITTFALLVLRLGISEKVATPTSVILMACNAVVGFAWQGLVGGGMAPEAWSYWWVCVPVVVIGAPFGAWFIRDRSRHFVSAILYASILVQFVGALVIVPMTAPLAVFSVTVLSAGVLFFRWMANQGVRRMEWFAHADAAGEPGSPR